MAVFDRHVQVEKAFAIEAEAGAIWDALWAEVQAQGPERVESARRPEELTVRVSLTRGVDASITYRITQIDAGCEVSATLEASGFRSALYQVMTFGRLRTHYAMMLVEGLANLKEAVESAR